MVTMNTTKTASTSIILANSAKKANSTFFNKSGICNKQQPRTQRPFIVFRRKDNMIRVEIVEDVETVLTYPARTRVMTQWEGKNRSDYYHFTVAQLRDHINSNAKN